jgi:hypothetical protein
MRPGFIKWILIFLGTSACVEPISFEVPPPRDLVVIDGSITDAPGPYTVKIGRGLALDADSTGHSPINGAVVKLFDDQGNIENMVEEKPGQYISGGVIRGTIGHTYHITIQMPDGTTFESEPEKIHPSGAVKAIKHQFEARTDVKEFGILPADVFNVFVDAEVPITNGEEAYVRWRMTGTYLGFTYPELHTTWSQGFVYKTPFSCSGYTVAPAEDGGILEKIAECVCCSCYITQHETKPHLSDAELVTEGQFRNIKVGEVPISGATFYDKYHVEVEQMTLSRSVFEFFKLIRSQKDAPSNLFQPAPGKLVGNIRSSNKDIVVVGIFWATSISRESIFLRQGDLPYTTPQNPFNTQPCYRTFAEATTVKPAFWE